MLPQTKKTPPQPVSFSYRNFPEQDTESKKRTVEKGKSVGKHKRKQEKQEIRIQEVVFGCREECQPSSSSSAVSGLD